MKREAYLVEDGSLRLAAAGAELFGRIRVASLYVFGEAGWSKRPFSKAAVSEKLPYPRGTLRF